MGGLRGAMAALMMLAATAAGAQQPAADDMRDSPSGEAMAFDLLVVRPIGLVGSVAGIGLFLVSLPVDLITLNVSEPANRLVVEPLKFTFTRRLGALE
ncbi:MAG: hypothetical protein HYV18_08825 [Gammaproteobacteria bacterium]|nr:hypothetical protein [Gammaproteobacteria bacterium]